MNDRPEILERLKGDDKFLLTTHENPDGDALGSLVSMNGILQAMGKDTVMFMRETEFPLPYEYRYLLAEDGAIHFEPEDLAERTVIYLDCGSFERMRVDFLKDGGRTLINIDHHHDNTEFGELNMVESKRSSTAEIVYSIAKELGVAAHSRSWPTRSTSVWSPTPVASCTRTPAPRRTRWLPICCAAASTCTPPTPAFTKTSPPARSNCSVAR